MRVGILSSRDGWHIDALRRALAARGHDAVVVPYESLRARVGSGRHTLEASAVVDTSVVATTAVSVAGSSVVSTSGSAVVLSELDAVLPRIIPSGSLEQLIFRVDALHGLEAQGVVVMNGARAIERCVDKSWAATRLHDAGVPVPETITCERATDALEVVAALGDVVVKPLFGSMGAGMVRVSDPDVAWRVFRALEQVRAVFHLQRFIDHGGRDYRAFVVGGQVLASIERHNADDWRTNVARGARAVPCTLPAAWASLAVQAAAAVGADYAGVDLLQDRDGQLYVLEVNAIPAWEGVQGATGLDVAAAIVRHLEVRVVGETASAGP